MTRRWIVEHRYLKDWVIGSTREAAETAAMYTWFGGDPTEFIAAEAWGAVSVRCLKPEISHVDVNLHPLFDNILNLVRPPKP
jgi:hypothetical protein